MKLELSSSSVFYKDDFCTIIHGDCEQFLGSLELVDLVLTDPPYGIGEAAGKNISRVSLAQPKDYGVEDWDDQRISKELLYLVLGAGRRSIIFGGNYYSDLLNASASWLVWDKDNTGDFSDCELAWTSLPGSIRRKKWRWNGMLQENMRNKEDRFHPTQKPVPLMQWCIETADVKAKVKIETVLDPFMGSGSTLVACKNLGRKAIGIEKSEKYCEIAAKRLSQEVLFGQYGAEK